MSGTADVSVRVYDLLGQERTTLHNGSLGPGPHVFTLEGNALDAGAYILAVTSRTGPVVSRKMIVR